MAVNGTEVLSTLLPLMGLVTLLVAGVVRHPVVMKWRWGPGSK